MSAPEKAHHTTEEAPLRLHGPVSQRENVLRYAREHGYHEVPSPDPDARSDWREDFTEFEDNWQGSLLRDVRELRKLTQTKLSDMTGIPQRHISEMERGRRPIGKKNAQRLGKALNYSYQAFL